MSEGDIEAKSQLEEEAPEEIVDEHEEISDHELGHHLSLMRRYPPLKKQEDFERLHETYLNAEEDAATRMQARDLITYGNTGLVIKQAMKFRGLGISLQDLVQCGLEAVALKALPGYEREKGTRFSTYAVWWIRFAMGRVIQDERSDLATRVPVHVHESFYRLLRLQAEFIRKHHRPPTTEELADALGLKGPTRKERVEKILKRGVALARPMSFDGSLGDADDDSRNLHNVLHVEKHALSEYAPRKPASQDPLAHTFVLKVLEAMRGLNPRTLDVLVSRFAHDDTLEEIGERYDLSRERVRQLQEEGCTDIGIALRLGKLQVKEILIHLADCVDLSALLPVRPGLGRLDEFAPPMLDFAYSLLGEHVRYGSRPPVVPQPARVLEIRLDLHHGDAVRLIKHLSDLGWIDSRDEEAVLIREPVESEAVLPARSERIVPLPKATWSKPKKKRKQHAIGRGDAIERSPGTDHGKTALEALLANAVQVMGGRYVRAAVPVLQRECRFRNRKIEELLKRLVESGDIVALDGWRMIRIGKPVEMAKQEDVVKQETIHKPTKERDAQADSPSRENLTVVDLADAAHALKQQGCTQAVIAKRFSRSEAYISRLLKLRANLAPAVLESLGTGEIPIDTALVLANLSHETQLQALERLRKRLAAGDKTGASAEARAMAGHAVRVPVRTLRSHRAFLAGRREATDSPVQAARISLAEQMLAWTMGEGPWPAGLPTPPAEEDD